MGWLTCLACFIAILAAIWIWCLKESCVLFKNSGTIMRILIVLFWVLFIIECFTC